MALRSTQPLTETSTRDLPWVLKTGLTTLPPSCAEFFKNLLNHNFLEPAEPIWPV